MASVQPNMQVHEDLAALFSRNLSFNPELPSASSEDPAKSDSATELPPAQPATYSISQHYHHSGHTAKPQGQAEDASPQELQRSSSEPSQAETLTSEHILRLHGVDPYSLTPSQLQLFRIAEAPQRMRLLELWSICPPNGGGDIPALAWSSTSLEQEEYLTRLRFEKAQNEQVMSLDGTPIQASNGQWVQPPAPESEPYMSTGYEELMRRERERERRNQAMSAFNYDDHTYTHATDPIYGGPDSTRLQQQQMDMASQYGNFDQFRRTGEVDAMDVM